MIRLSLSILLFLIFHLTTSGQIVSSLSVSNDTITIGEEISVYYKLTLPKTSKIRGLSFSNLDSLDSLTPTSSIDTSSIPYYAEVEWAASFMNYENKLLPFHLAQKSDLGNKYEYRDTFLSTFWDLGFYELPHPVLQRDSSSTDKIMRLENPTVFVTAPNLQNPDTTSIILPIKGIITTQKTWKDYLSYLWFLLPLLLVFGFLYLYIAKKNKIEEVEYVAPPKEPAHVIALGKLDNLAREQDWKNGKVKKYQSDLTYTIREYLENRYAINALESTTDEITRALAKNDFSSEHESELKNILQIADLVKFAKAQPTEDINETFLAKAKAFVMETKEVITLTESEDSDG